MCESPEDTLRTIGGRLLKDFCFGYDATSCRAAPVGLWILKESVRAATAATISAVVGNKFLMEKKTGWFRDRGLIGASDPRIIKAARDASEKKHGTETPGVGERFLRILRYVQRDKRS